MTPSKSYAMPPAVIGPCLWRRLPADPPLAGMITQVNQRSVSLILFPPDTLRPFVKEGVRHVSDPELRRLIETEAGCWDYTDQDKRMREIEAKLGAK